MLVSALLNSSLRKIGGLSSGEVIETARQNEALEALQVMLRGWSGLSASIFATITENLSTVAGRASNTWGTGGQWNSLRPNQVIGAYITDSAGASHPVDVKNYGEYAALGFKGSTGRPLSLFFHPGYPLATAYLWPVPDAVETITIESYKPFVEVDSFDIVGSTIAFPAFCEEAIIYNLAVRLAPEYGKSASAEVIAIAGSSFKDMEALNASLQVKPVYIQVPAGRSYGSGYSINTDTYK